MAPQQDRLISSVSEQLQNSNKVPKPCNISCSDKDGCDRIDEGSKEMNAVRKPEMEPMQEERDKRMMLIRKAREEVKGRDSRLQMCLVVPFHRPRSLGITVLQCRPPSGLILLLKVDVMGMNECGFGGCDIQKHFPSALHPDDTLVYTGSRHISL